MTRDEANDLFRNAWDRDQIQHEWFDGETEIAEGYRQRLIADFRANGPTRVTVYPDWNQYNVKAATTDFATRLEAEHYAQRLGREPELVHVAAIRGG